MSSRSMPCAVVRLVTVPVRVDGPAGLDAAVGRLGLLAHDGDALAHRIVPFQMRPTAIRPT